MVVYRCKLCFVLNVLPVTHGTMVCDHIAVNGGLVAVIQLVRNKPHIRLTQRLANQT